MGTKTVYSISSGCYSDYGVSMLFASRELAVAYIKQDRPDWDGVSQLPDEGYADPFIEEFLLHDEVPRRAPYKQYVSVKPDGQIRDRTARMADLPFENRRSGESGEIWLEGHAEWVDKVASDISAERRARAAGIA